MPEIKNVIINELKEFEDLGQVMRTASGAELERVYVRDNKYVAIIGYKMLKDFARFTSHEDLSIDTINFAGKTRVYLTGLKRRAVMRRASEAILREFDSNYNCATPDHQCMECYNCYAYGGVIAIKNKTKAIKSRVKTTTSFSVQSDDEIIIDEPEFHNIIHTDLKMEQTEEQKKASLYEMVLIKPNTVFPFIDVIFTPTKFDLAMYLETVKRADAEGYGSRSSLLGTMQTEIIVITTNLNVSQKDLLDGIHIDEKGNVDDSQVRTLLQSNLIDVSDLEALRDQLPDLIETHRQEIYPEPM
jgi:CRISPR type I-D-associated protein Csc2